MRSIFLNNKTTKILSVFLGIDLIIPVVLLVSGLLKEIHYTSIKNPTVVDVENLEALSFSDNNYVTLTNFCIDSNTIEHSGLNGNVIDAYYIFLNNFCDSVKGPVVVVEFDKTTFDELNSETDSTQILNKYFSGRFYKGYRSELVPFIQMKQYIQGNNLYTLKAGVTPMKQFNKNMNTFYFSLGICLILGIILFVAIIKNRTPTLNNKTED